MSAVVRVLTRMYAKTKLRFASRSPRDMGFIAVPSVNPQSISITGLKYLRSIDSTPSFFQVFRIVALRAKDLRSSRFRSFTVMTAMTAMRPRRVGV